MWFGNKQFWILFWKPQERCSHLNRIQYWMVFGCLNCIFFYLKRVWKEFVNLKLTADCKGFHCGSCSRVRSKSSETTKVIVLDADGWCCHCLFYCTRYYYTVKACHFQPCGSISAAILLKNLTKFGLRINKKQQNLTLIVVGVPAAGVTPIKWKKLQYNFASHKFVLFLPTRSTNYPRITQPLFKN